MGFCVSRPLSGHSWQTSRSSAITFRLCCSGCVECRHLTSPLSPPDLLGGGAGLAEHQGRAVQLQILRPADLGKSLSLAGPQGHPLDTGQEPGPCAFARKTHVTSEGQKSWPSPGRSDPGALGERRTPHFAVILVPAAEPPPRLAAVTGQWCIWTSHCRRGAGPFTSPGSSGARAEVEGDGPGGSTCAR
ncbi:unnamed protein product [Rangifer tarandus platyrhynchus]|uniref:Uncharacterized protein n=1 Tax=Rangifer tarandus platyrhynchus TaxID=3082113 RepID=A0AC59Z744_RANTA